MQISSLIIAPAFMAAGNYILLGRIIPVLGTRYSFIHPLSYTIVFVVGDVISLVIQAIGGGQASAAETNKAANDGAKVMVGGVMFQMVVMVAYSIVLLAFVIRYKTDRPISAGRQIHLFSWWPNALRPKGRKKPMLAHQVAGRPYTGSDEGLEGEAPRSERLMSGLSGQTELLDKGEKSASGHQTQPVSLRQRFGEDRAVAYTEREIRGARILLWACAASTLLIFIRSVYRSIELIDGWEGAIMKKQTLFDLLDGMLMALAVWIFNIVHPGWFLPRHERVVGNAV
jgi:hypothetical protein